MMVEIGSPGHLERLPWRLHHEDGGHCLREINDGHLNGAVCAPEITELPASSMPACNAASSLEIVRASTWLMASKIISTP